MVLLPLVKHWRKAILIRVSEDTSTLSLSPPDVFQAFLNVLNEARTELEEGLQAVVDAFLDYAKP